MSDSFSLDGFNWRSNKFMVLLSMILMTFIFIVYGVTSARTHAQIVGALHEHYTVTTASPHHKEQHQNVTSTHTAHTVTTASPHHKEQHQNVTSNHTAARLQNSNLRILCLILTMEADINTKVRAVNSTWVTRGCDRYFYIISTKRRHKDFLNIDIPDSRKMLIHKMQKVYRIIYEKYINDFDYILKADDDTFVLMENLRFLLSHYDKSALGYLGFHFNHFVTNGYMSGGAGYVISNSALRHMIENGYNKKQCEVVPNPDDPENSEDLETGKCLQSVGVPVLSSVDNEGRETFHPYPPEQHLLGGLPGYIYSWAKNPIKRGRECCSWYTISYHYLQPRAIYLIDHLLYHTKVHGLNEQEPENKHPFKIGKVT